MGANNPAVKNVTILNTATESSVFDMNPLGSGNGKAVVGVLFPAALTGTLLNVQGEVGDGVYRAITDKDGNVLQVSKTDNAIAWIDPAATAGCRSIRLVSDAAEGADRTIGILFRAVS